MLTEILKRKHVDIFFFSKKVNGGAAAALGAAYIFAD